MCRGRLGYEWCCGELSEEEERLPPSLASGSCKAEDGGDGEEEKKRYQRQCGQCNLVRVTTDLRLRRCLALDLKKCYKCKFKPRMISTALLLPPGKLYTLYTSQ